MTFEALKSFDALSTFSTVLKNVNDSISDDVIDGVINCTSVMRKCLFVNKSGVPVVDVNT